MQDFEKHIRMVMRNAEEEVPPQVWDAVSRKLDRSPGRRVVALPWRGFAAAVAAAAAIAAGVFLFLPKHPSSTPYIAGVLPGNPVRVLEPGLTPAREIALLPDRTAWTPEETGNLPQEVPAAADETPSAVPPEKIPTRSTASSMNSLSRMPAKPPRD